MINKKELEHILALEDFGLRVILYDEDGEVKYDSNSKDAFSPDQIKEIKQMEDAGVDVVVHSDDGRTIYSTNSTTSSKYCDNCKDLRFYPDPDPNDWFRDDDKKAVCERCKRTIADGLSYNELTNIRKPFFCPKSRSNFRR